MPSFLVTELQAGKLPRWALWLLCLLYTLPGLAGRDPWRADDAAGFGIAFSMARGGTEQWLMPSIAGEPIFEEGPLPFWVAALAIRAAPMLAPHLAAQLATMLCLGLLFVAVWCTTFLLARRPAVQPADPFEASASPQDFGRAIADSAVLVLMAMIGVIARLHETSAEPMQLLLVALFLWGAALSLQRPLLAGVLAGTAIAASTLTRGLLPAAALLLAATLMPLFSPTFRLNARPWLASTLPIALGLSAAWPLALGMGAAGEQGDVHLLRWLSWNAGQFLPPDHEGLVYYLRTVPWYFWPAWPIALWSFIRWRARLDEPMLTLPLASLAALWLAALIGSRSPESQLLMTAVSTAMLAAIGLPTLRRSMTSLIDWFAVMTYTVLGIVVWAYWIAMVTGVPSRMAARISVLLPGYQPQWLPIDLLMAIAITLAWLALLRWRAARHRPALWRPLALSCGGLVLAWVLLMTLWLPAFNYRNTYRELAHQLAAALPPGQECLATQGLGHAQRATLHYFGKLPMPSARTDCPWLLSQEIGERAREPAAPPSGWRLAWQGSRPRDKGEILRLYRRDG